MTHTAASDDRTTVAGTDGKSYFVDLFENTRQLAFTHTNGPRIAEFSFDAIGGVEDGNGLWLDLGQNIGIDGDTLTTIKVWANLDAFGQRQRAEDARMALGLPPVDPDTLNI